MHTTSKGKMAFSLIFVDTTCSSRCRTCPSQGLRYRRQAVSWGYLDQSQLARAQSQWQQGQMWPPRWCLTSQSPENTMLESVDKSSPNVPKVLLQGEIKEVLEMVPADSYLHEDCDYWWKWKFFPQLLSPKTNCEPETKIVLPSVPFKCPKYNI